MPALFTLKDHFKESKLFLNRTLAAGIIIILLTLILIFRLVNLQIIHHEHFNTLSRNNQIRIVPLPPPRGLIFDRHGQLIAENIPAFSLEVITNRVLHINKTLEDLKTIINISEQEIQTFHRQRRYKNKNDSVPLKIKLTEEEVARFSIEKYRFPGIEIVARLIRHYIEPELYAHVLGYVGPLNEKELNQVDTTNYRGTYHIGKLGLEKYYEEILHGKVGFQHIETDAKGRLIRVIKKDSPQSGENLYLSIDTHLQKAAYKALGKEKGAVVIIDPNTGEVLALVSTPAYDPNSFVQGISYKEYRALQDSSERPLFNRAIRGQYPPASTVKPLVALKGLEQGVVNPQFEIFDPGWFQLNNEGRFYRDSDRRGHGWTNLDKALMQSCDTYFWQLALKLGVNHLYDIYTRFGLGSLTGIDISHEAKGLVPSKEWKLALKKEAWYVGETLNIGIGQGDIMATPIQLAQVAATIAKRGKRFQPRLLLAKGHFDSPNLTSFPPKLLPSLEISDIHWDVVINAMRKVIHTPGGTAYRISKDIKYEAAAKTGTAQVFSLKQNERYEAHKIKSHLLDHGLFIAFAPVNKPEVVISVVTENNSRASKEIARTVLDAFFDLKNNYTPKQIHSPQERKENDE
ncbi:MAG: penicillin-binding protein [Francisellaceae bacterium]|nr:penicillin-binding protein [Francisellaceae bacterium]